MGRSYPWYVTPNTVKKLAAKLYVERYEASDLADEPLAFECLKSAETFFRVASEVQDGNG